MGAGDGTGGSAAPCPTPAGGATGAVLGKDALGAEGAADAPSGGATTSGKPAGAAASTLGSMSASKVYLRLNRSAAQPPCNVTLTTGSSTGRVVRTRITAPSCVADTPSDTLDAGRRVSP